MADLFECDKGNEHVRDGDQTRRADEGTPRSDTSASPFKRWLTEYRIFVATVVEDEAENRNHR
jgi:hypothetical protein